MRCASIWWLLESCLSFPSWPVLPSNAVHFHDFGSVYPKRFGSTLSMVPPDVTYAYDMKSVMCNGIHIFGPGEQFQFVWDLRRFALSKDLKSPQYPMQHNLLGFLHSICHYINSTNFADPMVNLFFVLILTCITVSITIEAHGPFRCHPPNHYCSKTGQQFTCCSAKHLSFCPIPWLPSWFFHKVLSIAWAIL